MTKRTRSQSHLRHSGSQGIGELQARQQRDEFRNALRALLMQPLLGPAHPDFPAIRRQAAKLREWFAREVGWILHVERDGARLYKRPADLHDPRGVCQAMIAVAMCCCVWPAQCWSELTLRLRYICSASA